jgi:predicted nucleic acid-binding protein
MGVILDSSILIAYERRRFNLEQLLIDHTPSAIAAVTAGELLVGVERADTPERRARREEFIENLCARLPVIGFELPHARLWAARFAELLSGGTAIGDRDLQIAVTAIHLDYELATLNMREFQRVSGLRLLDVSRYIVQ